jgi:uncharacterized membrane protein required for colicin V production
MILAATVQNSTPWWHKALQGGFFNWFDFVLIGVLIFGFWRGRKRGMSREAVPASMWLVLVIAAGLGYQFLGQWLIQAKVIHSVFGNVAKETTAAYVSSYLLISLVVFIIFSMIGKHFREKVTGSNTFGSNEYYFGMVAGTIRYACILMFILALMNAPYYTTEEKVASAEYKARWYGGGLNGYSGDFIPDFSEVQESVFKKSLSGPFITSKMDCLLIVTTQPLKKTASVGLH